LTGQTEDHVPWIRLSQDLKTVHSHYTHTQKQCTARGSSWGLQFISLTAKGSWIHLWGRVAKPLVSSLMPVPPHLMKALLYIISALPSDWTSVILDPRLTATWIILHWLPSGEAKLPHHGIRI